MSASEQLTFSLTIPVPHKYIGCIFGKNGENIKKIATDAGNQTYLSYDDATEVMNISSYDMTSAKFAGKAILTIINGERKSTTNKTNTKPINKPTTKPISKPISKNNDTNKQVISQVDDDRKVQQPKTRYLDVLKPSNNSNYNHTDGYNVKKTDTQRLSSTDKSNLKKAEIPRATRIIKHIRIHPDIIKAGLIYQIIGSKGSNIKQICEAVGRNCNILCIDNSYYKIDVANEVLFKMSKDLLIKLENQVLNNPENEDTIARARGYYIINFTNGKKEIIPYEEKCKLIEMYKKKETIRYQLANKMNVHINDIDDCMIDEEYNSRYIKDDRDNTPLMTVEEIQESFKSVPVSPTSSASIRMNMYSKWNDELGIILMKNELPNSVNTINNLTKLIVNKRLLDKERKLQKQQQLEKEIIELSLDSLLDEMELDMDVFEDDGEQSDNDTTSNNSISVNDTIMDDDLNDIDFCENHNTMADYDEYDKYLDNIAIQNSLPMVDAWN
jgi:hypothetical protein